MNNLLFKIAYEVADIIENTKGRRFAVVFQPRLALEKEKLNDPKIFVCPHSLEIVPTSKYFDKYTAVINVNFIAHTKFLDTEKLNLVYQDVNLVDSVLRRRNLMHIADAKFRVQWVSQTFLQEPGWEYEVERRAHIILATIQPNYIFVGRDMIIE